MEDAKDGVRMERVPLGRNATGQALILVALSLIGLGVVMVASTVAADRGCGLRAISAPDTAAPAAEQAAPHKARWYYRRDIRQGIFAAAAAVILLTLWRFDYTLFARRAKLTWAMLAVAAASAVVVLILGRAVGGRLRWLRYGPVGFQPSEALKVAVLIALAAFLARRGERMRSFGRTFLPAIAVVGVSCGLVVTQDFGTAVIIGLAAAVLMLMAGVPLYHFWLPAGGAAAAFYFFVYRVPYRWERILALFDPGATTRPAAYQPMQAAIAIASGADPAGLGRGVARYDYLPEDATDFIFAPICEELGVIGVVLVIGLFLIWLWLVRRAVVRSADRFGALLAGGLGFLVGLQAAMHIAVNVKCLPPTGISLPFLSAGGSGMLVMAAAAAMIVSVTARRRATAPDSL